MRPLCVSPCALRCTLDAELKRHIMEINAMLSYIMGAPVRLRAWARPAALLCCSYFRTKLGYGGQTLGQSSLHPIPHEIESCSASRSPFCYNRRRDALRRNAQPVTDLAACQRESSAGLIALLEGLSKFGATLYASPPSMDNPDPYGSDHRCT